MTSITVSVYNQFSKSFCLMVTLIQNIKVQRGKKVLKEVQRAKTVYTSYHYHHFIISVRVCVVQLCSMCSVCVCRPTQTIINYSEDFMQTINCFSFLYVKYWCYTILFRKNEFPLLNGSDIQNTLFRICFFCMIVDYPVKKRKSKKKKIKSKILIKIMNNNFWFE